MRKRNKGLEVKAAEVNEANQKVINDFIADPYHLESARVIAQQIHKHVSKNWFSVNQVVEKFNIHMSECLLQLEMLKMFKFCVCKLNSKSGKLTYKITFDKKHQ